MKYEDGFNIGNYIYNSWGYDQTNIDFYLIVKRTKATVWVVPVGSLKTYSEQMQGTCVPSSTALKADEYLPLGKWDGITPIKKRLLNNSSLVKSEFGCARLWDGKPKRFSTYA